MLGWHISVFRQADGGNAPALFGAAQGTRLAVWQTGLGGLSWIDALVKDEKAISLGGDGYPLEYTATAANLKPQLLAGPPGANSTWARDPGDIVLPGWAGKTVKDLEALEACPADEWLLIQAWDES